MLVSKAKLSWRTDFELDLGLALTCPLAWMEMFASAQQTQQSHWYLMIRVGEEKKKVLFLKFFWF